MQEGTEIATSGLHRLSQLIRSRYAQTLTTLCDAKADLLDGVAGDEAVHVDVPELAHAEGPVHRLQVVRWVPAGVDDHHPARRGFEQIKSSA